MKTTKSVLFGVSSGARRRLTHEDAEERKGEQQMEWEEEEEEGGHRRLQVLTGGEFCALAVTDGALAFADADCVPVAPVRD